MGGAKDAFTGGASKKGKRVLEVGRSLPASKEVTEGVRPMEVDDVGRVDKVRRSKSDLEDSVAMLSAQIASALATMREVRTRREIHETKERNRANPDGMLMQLHKEVKDLEEAMKDSERNLAQLNKTKKYLFRKGQEGRWHVRDDCAMLDVKLGILRWRRYEVDRENQVLKNEIHKREEDYLQKALEGSSEIEEKANNGEFGNTRSELQLLRRFALLHCQNIPLLRKELDKLENRSRYLRAWRKWKIATSQAKRVDVERAGPEPEEKDFVSGGNSSPGPSH